MLATAVSAAVTAAASAAAAALEGGGDEGGSSRDPFATARRAAEEREAEEWLTRVTQRIDVTLLSCCVVLALGVFSRLVCVVFLSSFFVLRSSFFVLRSSFFFLVPSSRGSCVCCLALFRVRLSLSLSARGVRPFRSLVRSFVRSRSGVVSYRVFPGGVMVRWSCDVRRARRFEVVVAVRWVRARAMSWCSERTQPPPCSRKGDSLSPPRTRTQKPMCVLILLPRACGCCAAFVCVSTCL